ncbi:hypothetical protein [Caldicoprobacter faecalis]|uniref:Uncharacterized protein n=1 Tax=Caldicoprobacter faecalis TaxID=937334 RepID=A0A1I5VYR4_9FIRM|nr:hypothetical protein [Caldicoprobacter faecalis]SFQ12664.1 hypothetical protein SAMN05444406_11333 [Caldicoprobacter faecalis]
MAYKKCPRCNLNYIKDTESLCKVCLEEVGKSLNDTDREEEYDICPECGENIIEPGEEMCYQCAMEHMKEAEEDRIESEGWDDFLLTDEEDLEIFDEDIDNDLSPLEDLEDLAEPEELEPLEDLEIDEEFDEEFEDEDEEEESE